MPTGNTMNLEQGHALEPGEPTAEQDKSPEPTEEQDKSSGMERTGHTSTTEKTGVVKG